MSKQVLWVIKEKHTDHIFSTLKEAKASTVGFDDWFFGSSNNIRIIARVVLDRFRKRKQKGTNE
jgi:hypothetical protein